MQRTQEEESSMSSPNNMQTSHIQPGNNFMFGAQRSPEPEPLSQMIEIVTQNGIELSPQLTNQEITENAIQGSTAPLPQEQTSYTNSEATPPSVGENETLFSQRALKIITLLIYVSSGGIFGFLQVQNASRKINPALHIIYIACNVCFSAWTFMGILYLVLALTHQRFARNTLILKLVMGVSLVLIMLNVGLVLAFNLQKGSTSGS